MILMETAGEDRQQNQKYHTMLQDAVQDILWRYDPDAGSAGDAALLAYFYLEAYARTGQPCYRRAARCTLDRLLEDGTYRERADWTGLLIVSLVKADRILGDERFLKSAQDLKGRLSSEEASLENCAFACWSMVELYESGFAAEDLQRAIDLADKMSGMYWDVCPAAGIALVKLARITGAERFQVLAERQLEWTVQDAGEDPVDRCIALLAVIEAAEPRWKLVCASRERIPGWLAAAVEIYRLAVLSKTAANEDDLAEAAPWTADLPIPQVGETLYLCRKDSCMPPVGTVAALRELFREQSGTAV